MFDVDTMKIKLEFCMVGLVELLCSGQTGFHEFFSLVVFETDGCW